jgi:hypothetical protein
LEAALLTVLSEKRYKVSAYRTSWDKKDLSIHTILIKAESIVATLLCIIVIGLKDWLYMTPNGSSAREY